MEKGALQLEVLQAVSRKKRRPTPQLSWIFDQCTGSELFELYDGDTTSVSILEKQTYRQWKSLIEFQKVAHPRRLRQRTITIQPLHHKPALSGYTISEIDASVLKHLQNVCEAFFHTTNVELTDPVDLAQIRKLSRRIHRETNREQFLVGDILKHLKSHRPHNAYCIAGVTLVDLYPSPDENFVLGHASLTSGCAVVSFGRYFSSLVAANEGSTSKVAQQLRNLWVLIRVSHMCLDRNVSLYCVCLERNLWVLTWGRVGPVCLNHNAS